MNRVKSIESETEILLAFCNRVIAGEKRAISRAITLIESSESYSEPLLNWLYEYTGKAYRIGITGPPGAGKSSITNQLAKLMLKANKKVGIIAVDPTSPFTGGALLGDRVRMGDIGTDAGIFIRSMATRGSLGGLSTKAQDTADILDAAGYDYIIFETVGVGQSELDIMKATDSVIVVLVPESGDSIQAMKAGLMEIANIYVVNKADRPGADQAVTAIQAMLMMRDHNATTWMPDVIKTIATGNKGIPELIAEIDRHQNHLRENELFLPKRYERNQERIREIVREKLLRDVWQSGKISSLFDGQEKMGEVLPVSPYSSAEIIINEYKKSILK